jgi:hypothetical protein
MTPNLNKIDLDIVRINLVEYVAEILPNRVREVDLKNILLKPDNAASERRSMRF